MKKLFWTLAPLLFIGSLFVLIIALTNHSPENPFTEYRLLTGLVFVSISSFIKMAYNNLYK